MAPPETPADGSPEFDAIRRVQEAWLAAEHRGDIEGVLALCTPDVRWLVPGIGLLVGPEAGRQLLSESQGKLEAITVTEVRIEVSGGLAYKTGRYEARSRVHGEAQVSRGTHLWILRRERASWRVALLTWQAER
jgi:ketosteroid isomerase-like protein